MELQSIVFKKDSMKFLGEYIRLEGDCDSYVYIKEAWLNDIPDKDYVKLSEIPGLFDHKYATYSNGYTIYGLGIEKDIPNANMYILFY